MPAFTHDGQEGTKLRLTWDHSHCPDAIVAFKKNESETRGENRLGRDRTKLKKKMVDKEKWLAKSKRWKSADGRELQENWGEKKILERK